jgi:hypothetical protein
MGDTADEPWLVFTQHGEKVVVRITLVKKHRLACLGRQYQVALKGVTLRRAGAKITEIVQPALADGHNLSIHRQCTQLLHCLGRALLGMMRVDAGRTEQATGAPVRQVQGRMARGNRAAGDHHPRDTGGRGSLDDLVTVVVEAVVREVGADVDQ